MFTKEITDNGYYVDLEAYNNISEMLDYNKLLLKINSNRLHKEL